LSSVEAFGLTDTGLVREVNEDRIHINQEDLLFVVADGMGGHAAGEVASGIAVDAVSEFIIHTRRDRELTWPYAYDENLTYDGNRLQTAVRLANNRIREAVEEESRYQGMGATMVSLLVTEDRSTIGSVGDSRVYLYRQGELKLLTNDHSWVNEQMQEGMLTEEQAKIHPFRNVVTRALGSDKKLLVDIRSDGVEGGDCYLLCSDGLTGMLGDEQIAGMLAGVADQGVEAVCGELVEAANQNGGKDNISVILVRFSN
jgi:serine/threonine protein phosphatase PrpC